MAHAAPFRDELDLATPTGTKAGRWAWGICWLMFASTALNYMDRQAVALVNPQIRAEFGIANEGFGWVLAAFYLSYALCQVPAGYLADRWNVRLAYAGAVAWWSLAGIAAAFSPTLGALLAFRALLGVGESFNWPCALRVTATILPPADRSLGNGIFNSGAAVGAVLTPLIVPPLTAAFGWRTAFVAVGILGFIWVSLWQAILGGRESSGLAGPLARITLGGFALGSVGMAVISYISFAVLLMRYLARPPLTLVEMLWPILLMVGSVASGTAALWLAWVASRLAIFGFERPPFFVGPTSPRDNLANLSGGLSTPALVAFGGVAAAALLIGVVGFDRFGLSAIWWGIALVMIGPLFAALILPRESLSGADWAESLGEVARLPRFWMLVVVSISINVCWHFLVGWMPTYLRDDRGMTYLASGLFSALPFLAADVGNLGGGALSRTLARRGMEPARARIAVVALCTLLISSGAWVGAVRSNALTLVLLGVMALGAAAFMANYFAFCQEVSARHTGLIVGILGGLGNLFAAGFAPIAGKVRDTTGGFAPIFVVVGLLPFVGLAVLALGWRRTESTES